MDGVETAFTAGTPVTENLTVTVEQSKVDKVYDGQTATLSVTASISAEGASFAYQWYRMDGGTPVKVEGADGASLAVVNAADSGAYFCRVTAALDGVTLTDRKSVV